MLCAKAVHGNPGSGPSAAWSLGQIPASRGGDRKSMLESNTAEPSELHSLAEEFKDPSAKSREQGKNTAWQALKVVFFFANTGHSRHKDVY